MGRAWSYDVRDILLCWKLALARCSVLCSVGLGSLRELGFLKFEKFRVAVVAATSSASLSVAAAHDGRRARRGKEVCRQNVGECFHRRHHLLHRVLQGLDLLDQRCTRRGVAGVTLEQFLL